MTHPIAASRNQVAVALATVYVVWGSTYLGMRIAVTELPPLLVGGSRNLIAGATFLLLALALPSTPRPARREIRNAVLLGLALVGISNGLVIVALRDVTSSLTALILAIMPLWVALIELFRPGGARPTARALVGIAVGFLGTAFLVWRPGGGLAIEALPFLMLILATINWAAASVAGRIVARPQSSLVSSGIEMCAGGLAQLAVGACLGEARALAAMPGPPSARAMVAFVYLVVVGSWAGYGAFSWLTRHAPPTLVATYAYVNPLVAVILGVAIGAEALAPRMLVAGAVIVGAVVLVTTARTRGT